MVNRVSFWPLIWDVATRAAYPLFKIHLRRRVSRGKENPDRWREKLGEIHVPRPEGRLVWMHAVGLGEVLALRGLIDLFATRMPDAHFLVTSGTRVSAEVFAQNIPPNTIHQFAPIDVAGPTRRFLDHWRPDLSIWAEQDIWPGIVKRTADRGIPLALVNARMNQDSFARRMRWRGLFGDAFSRFRIVSCQDSQTAQHLKGLCAKNVRTDGSLKPLSPPLKVDGAELAHWQNLVQGRFIWVNAPSHGPDEAIAISACSTVLERNPDSTLIIAPRVPDRGREIAEMARNAGFSTALRSVDGTPDELPQVYVADTFGEMGLWYRLARAAFVGGTFGSVEGHNPWEARVLNVPVVFGPRTANFAADFADVIDNGVGRQIENADDLANTLQEGELDRITNAARQSAQKDRTGFERLAEDLTGLAARNHNAN